MQVSVDDVGVLELRTIIESELTSKLTRPKKSIHVSSSKKGSLRGYSHVDKYFLNFPFHTARLRTSRGVFKPML